MANYCNCWICGKEYKCCPKCKDYVSWKSIACTPKHYQVAMILREYDNKLINEQEAKDLFNNIGIKSSSDCVGYLEAVTEKIKGIIDTKPIQESNIKITDKPKTTKTTKKTNIKKTE